MKYENIEELKLFLDASVLYVDNKNLFEFEFRGLYNRLTKFIELNNLDKIKIVIPRITIDEIQKQYVEEYKSVLDNIDIDEIDIDKNQLNNKLSNDILNKLKLINIVVTLDTTKVLSVDEYEEQLMLQKKKFLEGENFLIAEYPINEETFEIIIQKAIKKEKPFFGGKDGKRFSDAGFKDVIFIESVKNYIKNERGEFIIITNDSDMFDMKMIEAHDKKIEIIGQDVIEYLCNRFEIQDFTKIKELVKNEYYQDKIFEAIKLKIKEIIDIKETDAIEEIKGFEITNLMEDDSKIKVFIIENEFVRIEDESGETIYNW